MAGKDIEQNPVPAAKSEDEDDSFGENYAMAIALGLPIGMLFGLLVFDNIAIGSAFGLAFAPIIALFMKSRKTEA